MSKIVRSLVVLLVLQGGVGRGAEPAANEQAVGVARVDITPRYAIRLNGFGFRRSESEGVQQRIWAKALAVGKENPAVVLTVDTLGISAELTDRVAKRLEKHGVSRERLAITATHTHTAPMLQGVCATIFGVPIPREHQAHIEQYTREFVEALAKVAVEALADRKPARLSWGIGRVGFASNRRTRGGPVDHDLPMLAVRSPEGKLRAVWVNYACHAVTLSHNRIGGDWPGHAQQAIEDDHPGVVALVSVGCGADSNPSSGVTGDKVEIASRQGMEIAREVKRLLGGYLAPVSGKWEVSSTTIELPLAELPSKEEWERRANRQGAVGHHARVQLERLARGEKLRTKIDYRVDVWTVGDALALVFLPGEVVVDYALRLKKELDGRRLWLNAYSNDAPGYVPSERILKEGGYEGGGAMVYYDIPAGYRAGLEEKIIAAVSKPLSKRFRPTFDPAKTSGTMPLSPQQSLADLGTKSGLTVDLVAAEPLVQSPVAIDFGPDGRLWVAEMADYPWGVKGDFKAGGRIVVLEDLDGDGIYDRRTVFLENIPFPTGVTVWRKGVLVCAAPDILYAEDGDGDGRAEVVRKLYSGFGTENYQARVNSLCYGLDGWVHGSCGLFGGSIRNASGQVVKLGDRDFRIRPDEGRIEAATGRTQQGRARDEWGNWFGCDNSTLARHYVLADHYLRRNPHVTYPSPAVYVPDYPESNRLYPRRALQLFKLSGPAGRVTAACGLGVYRDDLLGSGFTGNLFTCEPVNLSVHRLTLSPRGSSFSGRRGEDEAASEFLGSLDGWFRPVQMRTGPDGGLWIVDMYRFVIEHPRWIPPEELARVDARAGASLGRIYRVRPANRPLRKVPRLDRLTTSELVGVLESPNGTQRDLAGQMLLWRGGTEAVEPLGRLLRAARPETRMQALCVLGELGKLTADQVLVGLKDGHPGVRRQAIRLAEKFASGSAEVESALVKLVDDPDAQVRLQLACSLGEWKDAGAVEALARLGMKAVDDPYLTAAVLSSVRADSVGPLLTRLRREKAVPEALTRQLLGMAAAVGDATTLGGIVREIIDSGKGEAARLTALAGVLDALERRKLAMPEAEAVGKVLVEARRLAADGAVEEKVRVAAVGMLGRVAEQRGGDIAILGRLLAPQHSPALQVAALTALGRLADAEVGTVLLAGWKTYSPTLRGQVLDLLLGRPLWLGQVLAAIEKKEIVAGQIDATRRQRLVTHRDARVRATAARLLAASGSGDRRKVIEEYAGVVSLEAEAERGKAVFAKHCAGCHRLEGVGHEVGPDLAALANKTPQYLLGEILDPNRNLDSRYLQYLVTTQRGLTFTGLLTAETGTTLTLRLQEGKTQTLLRADIEEMVGTGKSLMPEGLEKDIGKADMAHLLAYLTRQTTPAKVYPGNRPAVVRSENGGYRLSAASAEIRGGDIRFEPEFGNVGYWHGSGDHVAWSVEVATAGTFDVWLDWACAAASAGDAFVVEGGASSLRGIVASTGGWDRYRQTKVGQIRLVAGVNRVTVRPAGAVRGALMDLRTVYLMEPGKGLPATKEKPQPKDAASIAKLLLDDGVATAKREAAIREHAALSAEILQAMTRDLKPGTKEEYRRIPWIWRVTIAAGRRNEAVELRRLLDVSLPRPGEPLRDWQAVVIGGGIINGISLVGKWPGERMQELVGRNEGLRTRWMRALEQSATMADDAKVPTGTRYDALRMIALDSWEKRGEQLAKYLAKGTHAELTMGAISGLSDVPSERVAALLLAHLEHFTPGNRKLAIEALVRTEARAAALVQALESGKLAKSLLTPEQVKLLRAYPNEKLRPRFQKVLE